MQCVGHFSIAPPPPPTQALVGAFCYWGTPRPWHLTDFEFSPHRNKALYQ